LLYERKIDSFRALIVEARNMDADAGLRILGTYDGRSSYVFVTRFGPTYTAMVYEKLPGARAVGRRLEVMERLELKDLESLLKKLVPGRITAFSY
jgi:hypothetical protein